MYRHLSLMLLLLFMCFSPATFGEEQAFNYSGTAGMGSVRITVSLPVQGGDIVVSPQTARVRAFALGWKEYKGITLRDYDVLAYTPEVAVPPLQRLIFPVGTGKEEYRISLNGNTTVNGELYGISIKDNTNILSLPASDTVQYIEIEKWQLTSEEVNSLASSFPNTKYINFAVPQTGKKVALFASELNLEFIGWGAVEPERICGWGTYEPRTGNWVSKSGYSNKVESMLGEISCEPSLKFLDLPGVRNFCLMHDTKAVFPILEGILFREAPMKQEVFEKYVSALEDLRILHLPGSGYLPSPLLPDQIISMKTIEHFSNTPRSYSNLKKSLVFSKPPDWNLISYSGDSVGFNKIKNRKTIQWLEVLSEFVLEEGLIWCTNGLNNLKYLRVRNLHELNYPARGYSEVNEPCEKKMTGLPATLRYLIVDDWAHGNPVLADALVNLEEFSTDGLGMGYYDEEKKESLKYPLRKTRIKRLRIRSFEQALQLQPDDGYETLELLDWTSDEYEKEEDFSREIAILKKFRAKNIYYPFLYLSRENWQKYGIDEIANLHTIEYDRSDSCSILRDIGHKSSWHRFGNPHWVLRHVTRAEIISE